ncbi:pyruvate phosphate dikinase PEP/pyruvate- binding [Desulfofarcimen acetoxidans DSM 771]|uniref:Pyruvate phosphate dikinase PEP/pyruvate-binding n=1 Tax=Desulfofarcimen acetoxidans (strain ATCC 49208 / DSM 771 / KCTC 5769 / VKM B-1644 / 5575) TaxID=485916 RepID=C8W3M3_DESAS|nr:PEP/pyruvate-binding domain-containing protein [Desulfofarcimen acetoxidans]ACV63809.1 pyruvate phosphate dikinase PEP/pyruvate- binding [Desulfofarcimen acetoxidans DSM 771]
MERLVYFFGELKTDQGYFAGGKAGTLAHLYQSGYPVPCGFIILPVAFENDELVPAAWAQVQSCLEQMRKDDDGISFAVRSSALCEDSSIASFAGQFQTVLDVCDDNEVRKAIQTVRRSRHSEGVRAYNEAKGINMTHDMAVVVQRLARADISGVLFTEDPITGNRNEMTGNFILGLGEELVSGQAKPFTFTLGRSNRIWRRIGYNGTPELKRFAGKLYKLGRRLEKELGCPQDIEWAIVDGKLWVLQSRPITTLIGYNPATGEWNETATGDFLWSNVNFGEAVPNVMTPLSWTVQQRIFGSWNLLPGYQASGNIGGRIYLNISLFASVLRVLGRSKKETLLFLEDTLYTRIPEGMEIPVIPLPKWSVVPILINFVKMQMKQNKAIKELPRYLAMNPAWCGRVREQIRELKKKDELNSLWHNEIEPHLMGGVWRVMGSASRFIDHIIKLRRDLTGMVGPGDANTLILSLSSSLDLKVGSGLLASLGPVLGIARVACGEMDRAEYMAQYGHRGPDEFELSVPRPAEDSCWLDEQLVQFRKSPADVEALLLKKGNDFIEAWNHFQTSQPLKARSMRRRIDQVALRARLREAVRSEYVRDRWVARTFALRAGQLTGLGDDIFFLTIKEVLDLLSGDETAVKYIPARKETYRKYLALPAYPPIIRGCFDPFRWGADPNRRNDIYDAYLPNSGAIYDANDAKCGTITGSAGSAGRVEGVVRCLKRPGEGDQLQKGEILVTPQTDIAWTPLFPRVAAIVTDVGAPLSHAAIVARELGIPAVVGCGNATMRLNTGDRVLVDGGKGVVMVLDRAGGYDDY